MRLLGPAGGGKVGRWLGSVDKCEVGEVPSFGVLASVSCGAGAAVQTLSLPAGGVTLATRADA